MEDRIRSQMEFLLAADGLKAVIRTSQNAGVDRFENSAEHSWQVALMAMVLAEHSPEPIQLKSVLEMLMVHDLVEVYAGDTLIYDEAALVGQAEREAQAAERLFALLPDDQNAHFHALWRQFEDAVTPEARYAKAVDALAPTWLHWGSHASPEPGDLRESQVLAKKAPAVESYPALWTCLREIVSSAAERGLIER